MQSSWAAKHPNTLSPLADKDLVPVAVEPWPNWTEHADA